MKCHPFKGFYLKNYQGFGWGEKKNPDEQLNKCHLFAQFTFIYLAKKTLIEIQIHQDIMITLVH